MAAVRFAGLWAQGQMSTPMSRRRPLRVALVSRPVPGALQRTRLAFLNTQRANRAPQCDRVRGGP
jgi:hypothetical protein